MKSKTYTQNKQPSDKTQSSKFCQLGVKRTRFQNRKKKGNDFFDRSTTLRSLMSLATDGKLQLIFSHSELLLENNKKMMLKATHFQRNVRCIVEDDAHLVDDW